MDKLDKTRQRLNSWLDILSHAVTDLRVDQHIFWEVQGIIRANPKSHTPGDFNRWMGRMYSSAISVAIRRQVDEDPRSVSFIRFLQEFKRTPTVVSRDRYVGFFRKAGLPDWLANRDFDKHVGAGRSFVSPAAIKGEVKELKLKTEPLRKYVNKRIAHHDEGEFTDFPKFQDIDGAIDYLEVLLKRYILLLRGDGLVQVLPYWQYDWKAVFCHPWITRMVDGTIDSE